MTWRWRQWISEDTKNGKQLGFHIDSGNCVPCLFPTTTFSQFELTANHLQLKVGTAFLHLKLLALIWMRICWICHWKVGPRNAVSLNILQNSMSYMGHTVLQLLDRQHVARTHLFHNAAYHLQLIHIDCQPIATEGGRYVQESHSIQFCRPEWKNTKQQGFHVWPANMLSGCSKQAAHISPILCRLRNSSPKTSLWTTESSIDFIHNRRVLANAFMSRCYKTAYPIRGIMFYNLLIFNILQTP